MNGDINILAALEWNAANSTSQLQDALERLEASRRITEIWCGEVKSRRQAADRHLEALVEYNRSHASPAIKP